MLYPNIYCHVSGMAMQCVHDFQHEMHRPPIALEIGCADGQGTMRYAGFCKEVICIDPMVSGRPDVNSNQMNAYERDDNKIEVFQRRTKDFPVKLLAGCSLWPEAIADVKKILADRTVDILIIDGCHHPFEAVFGDFEAYSPMVTVGGYVIFDDTYEECIQQVVDKVLETGDYVVHDSFSIDKKNFLQKGVSLKKLK